MRRCTSASTKPHENFNSASSTSSNLSLLSGHSTVTNNAPGRIRSAAADIASMVPWSHVTQLQNTKSAPVHRASTSGWKKSPLSTEHDSSGLLAGLAPGSTSLT